MRITVLFLFIGMCALGCGAGDEDKGDPLFDEFILSFRSEGFERGRLINAESLDVIIYFGELDSASKKAECRRFSSNRNEIVIDRSYWGQVDRLEREYIIFHEFGHCILNRDHLDDRDGNEECVSIMQSGQNLCIKIYTLENRARLLDELFLN